MKAIIETYLQYNGLVEVEISHDAEDWFPKIEINTPK